MSVDAIHLNLFPSTPAQKVALSVFVISLVALGIILVTAHYYNYNVLYSCSAGSLGMGALIVYILLSYGNKKNHTPVVDTVIAQEHPITSLPNNAGTEKVAKSPVIEPIVSITNVNLTLPKLVFAETSTTTVTADEEGGVPSKRGNKSLGVEEFDAWLQNNPIEGVEVPRKKVIAHEKNKKFLAQMDPEIFYIWDELSKQFETFQKTHDAKEWAQFLDSESVCKSLESVRQKIKQSFESVANDPTKNGFFRLRPWLKTISDKKSYLMVRSSGAEDSKECANAGKKLSLNYVSPGINAVLIATGQVLSSYFEVSPLKNWIEAGKNPFSNDLCLEVLLHALIGEDVMPNEFIEKTESEIPISGVLFTTEPDYSEPGFLVTKISAAPGHGDGVVTQADVATDTVYVVPSTLKKADYVEVYKKKSKSVRLAPVQEGDKVELRLVNNPLKLTYERALKPKIVERLVKLAKEYESYKGYPMDIEFVIKGETIYIVQARPVVRVEQKPSYLCPQKVETAKAVIEGHTCKVLVPGTSSVIVLRSPNELLIANRLKDADEGLFKSGLHKVVIVGLEESEDSHSIVNFSGKGITCLYATNLAYFHALSDSINDQQILLVCSQSGSVTLWDSTKAPFEKCVENGYFTHPADLRTSLEVPPQRPLHLHASSPQAIIEALSKLKTAPTAHAALNIFLELKKHAFVTTAEKAYTELRNKVGDYSGAVDGILQIFQQLQRKIEETVSELEANLQNNATRLGMLFHLKTLTSLISNTNMDIEGAYSLLHVELLNDRANRIAEYREKSTFYPPLLDHLVPLEEYALEGEGRKKWFDFLIALEEASKSGELCETDRNSFSQVLDKYENINILPLWFNFFFLPALKEQAPLQICLSTAHYLQAFLQPFFKQVERHRKRLDQLSSNLLSFGDVTLFPNSWKRLKEIGIFLSSDEFIETYKKADPCQKFIYFQLMKDYTTVNDLAIKAMKGNPKVLAEERVKKFALMVPANDKVLRAWLYKLIGENNLKLWEDWPLGKYFQQIIYEAWAKCKDRTDSTQLESSPGFNGLAMSLASSIQYDRELKPQTWEDLFTLTHQNQLYALSILMKQLCPETQSFSPLLHEAEKSISAIDVQPYIVRLFGVDFSMKEIKLHYNMILRNHSAMIHLIYKPTEPGIIVKVEMYGESRARFPLLLKWLKAMDHASMLNLIEEPIHTAKELSFSWKVLNQEQLNWVQQDLAGMIEYTLERLQYQVLDRFVNWVLANRKNYVHKIGEYFFNHLEPWKWNAIALIFGFLNSPEGEIAFNKFAVVHADRPSVGKQLQALSSLIEELPNLASEEDYHAGVKLLIESMSLISTYVKQKVEILSCTQLLCRFKRRSIHLKGIEKIEKELNTLIQTNDLPPCEQGDISEIQQSLESMRAIKPKKRESMLPLAEQ